MKKRGFVNGILQGFWILQPGNPGKCRRQCPVGYYSVGYNTLCRRALSDKLGGIRLLHKQPK